MSVTLSKQFKAIQRAKDKALKINKNSDYLWNKKQLVST
jgi:hypothetical protein